jgi:hypothetical protein
VDWSGKNKKGHYWEIQTMLLILCPDVMYKVVVDKEKAKDVATKEKFMNNLDKALKVQPPPPPPPHTSQMLSRSDSSIPSTNLTTTTTTTNVGYRANWRTLQWCVMSTSVKRPRL